MDISISLVTPAMNRQRGADAFDRGVSIDGHNMNPWVDAVTDWRKGWMDRKATIEARKIIKAAAAGCPP